VTTITSLDRVIQILVTAKYCRASTPLTVASVPFHFTAVLFGANRAPDLIVIVDTVEESEHRIRQKIESLGRALDVAGSRRPLTATRRPEAVRQHARSRWSSLSRPARRHASRR
jgi:hypothetical protein